VRHILAWLRIKGPHDDRSSVSLERLQSAITEAVKKSDPGCETFVGVIVRRETPKARVGANWALRGVRFGKADRDKVHASAREDYRADATRVQTCRG
jgi:hypothetical protein